MTWVYTRPWRKRRAWPTDQSAGSRANASSAISQSCMAGSSTGPLVAGVPRPTRRGRRPRRPEGSDPAAHRRCVDLIAGMLSRLRPDHPAGFRATLLYNQGRAYAQLPTGDRADALQRAAACFREALTVFTPEWFPVQYAMTQSALG